MALPKLRIGASSREVTALGVGCWAWGDRLVWGFGRGYGEPEVSAAFEVSRSAGLDFFDTAEIYGTGRSEKILGRLAVRAPGTFVATKFFPYPWRWHRGALRRAIRGSLRRLGGAPIDLYQIHWPSMLVPDRVWLEEMAEAAAEGRIEAIGVSNFSVRQMEQAAGVLERRGLRLASNQVSYGLLDRQPERSGLLERCRQMGVVLIAYSPLAMGLLTGKYGPDRPPPLTRRGRMGPVLGRIGPLLGELRRIGEAHGGKTPAQVALNWTLAKGTLPIPGAKNAAQARENTGALGWSLADDEVDRLDRVSLQVLSADA